MISQQDRGLSFVQSIVLKDSQRKSIDIPSKLLKVNLILSEQTPLIILYTGKMVLKLTHDLIFSQWVELTKWKLH